MDRTHPHPTLEDDARGRRSERMMRVDLIDAAKRGDVAAVGYPDAVVASGAGFVYNVEHKDQARFKAPPFDGHGLPAAQADRYAAMYARTGVRTLLDVFEPDTGERYRAWLHVLETGRHFDTVGTVKTPRRVYPLANFTRVRS